MNNDWKEAKGSPPDYPEKQCDGENCFRKFKPTWHIQRRCPRCKKEKRPYKDADNPF